MSLRDIASNVPVVILCGGNGIRLGDNGEIIPKPLVYINKKSVLEHVISHYAKFGFKKFILCVGMKKEMFERLKDSLSKYGDIIILDTGLKNRTGSRFAQTKDLAGNSKIIALTYGDTYSDVDLSEVLAFHLEHGKLATLLAVNNPTRFRILGLIDGDDDVKGLAEKPILEKDFINGGYYFFNSSVFNLKTISISPDCVLENEVLEEMTNKKELYAYRHQGRWMPLDNERDKINMELKIR
jgi:glucose-1-phosphate cytidylyltransferase